MQHVVDQVVKLKVGEEEDYMTSVIKDHGNMLCLTCEGRGHLSNNCASKQRLDALVKGTQSTFAWGKLKSGLKMDHMIKKAEVASELRGDFKPTTDNATVGTLSFSTQVGGKIAEETNG